MIYTKYNASGNDFIITHSFIEKDYSSEAKTVCHRQNGIGADGFVVIVPCNDADFKWLFYNNDGSDASMCGNASRAVAHYAYTNNLTKTSEVTFLTGAGIIKANVDEDIVETQLTKPKILNNEFVELNLKWHLIDTGVPHLVTFVDDLNLFDINLCSEMRQKYNANINFAKIENGNIKTRTYERGVEYETLACGTGMAACFLMANHLKLVKDSVFVYPASLEQLTLSLKDGIIYFKGSVKKVFSASI